MVGEPVEPWVDGGTDAESTFVASACECGVAVRHDGLLC